MQIMIFASEIQRLVVKIVRKKVYQSVRTLKLHAHHMWLTSYFKFGVALRKIDFSVDEIIEIFLSEMVSPGRAKLSQAQRSANYDFCKQNTKVSRKNTKEKGVSECTHLEIACAPHVVDELLRIWGGVAKNFAVSKLISGDGGG